MNTNDAKTSNGTKIIIGVVLFLIVMLGFWYGMNKNESSVKETFKTNQPVIKEPIKIGAALTFTGKGASLGERLKNGIDLAVEKINKQGNLKLEVVYEDTLSEVDSAVSVARKLVDIDKVKVVIGPVRSNDVLAIAPITEQSKVILFTPIAAADEISQAGDYVFRNRESAVSHGKGMAKFLKNKNIDKLALFTAKSANSISYSKFFKEEFEKLGGQISMDHQYDENTSDFRTDILKAKNSGAKTFYLAVALGKDAGNLVKQIKELAPETLITGSAAIGTKEFLDIGLVAEGVIFSSPVFDLNDPKVQAFNETYKIKYNKDADAFEANAYDAVMLISDAIQKCGGEKTDCIRDYLYVVKDYPGMGGLTTFDKNGDVNKPIMLKTVKDGKFVKYED